MRQRFSEEWWIQLIWLGLYAAGNTTMVSVYGLVIFFWSRAYFKATSRVADTDRFAWSWYRYMTIAYCVVEVVGLGLYFVLPYLMDVMYFAILRALISSLISIFFVVSFTRLQRALGTDSDNAHALLSAFATGEAATAVREAEAATRRKLFSLRLVAAISLAGQLLRISISLYDAYLFSEGSRPAKSALSQGKYWIIVLVYYTAAEVLPIAGIFTILRRPASGRGGAGAVPGATWSPTLLRRSSDGGESPLASMHKLHTSAPDLPSALAVSRGAPWTTGSPKPAAAQPQAIHPPASTRLAPQRSASGYGTSVVSSLTTRADSFGERVSQHRDPGPPGLRLAPPSPHLRETSASTLTEGIVLGRDSPSAAVPSAAGHYRAPSTHRSRGRRTSQGGGPGPRPPGRDSGSINSSASEPATSSPG